MSGKAFAASGIGSLPTLPIFFKLRGRVAVLAGGSLPAVWKAELLAAAGARVLVFDPAPCPEMILLGERLGGALHIALRHWVNGDLDGAALAIGALQGAGARDFRQAARCAGVPVNIVDVPELCDFQFGTVVERTPLLVAISTDGAAPVFGQALRTRLEAFLPPDIRAWAQAAKDWRPDLQARAFGFAARRRFWEVFAERALAGNAQVPTDQDRQACMDAATQQDLKTAGSLDLVGLGPGMPDLLTLRAVRAMQSAEVILHSPEVSADILTLARREAQRWPEALSDAETAGEIHLLVEAGKQVVWAALGDPDKGERWFSRRLALSVSPRTIVAGLG